VIVHQCRKKLASDIQQLGEMMFGSTPMPQKASTLKVHIIRLVHIIRFVSVFLLYGLQIIRKGLLADYSA